MHVDDSLSGARVGWLARPPRRPRRRRRLPGPGARRGAARHPRRPDRVGRPQGRVHRAGDRRRRDRQRACDSRPLGGLGGEASRRAAARRTRSSRRARSAGWRRSPSSPRRCFARAACWSPGRDGATSGEEAELERAAARVAMGAEQIDAVGAARGLEAPPPPRRPQARADPGRLAAPPRDGEEAAAGSAVLSSSRF